MSLEKINSCMHGQFRARIADLERAQAALRKELRMWFLDEVVVRIEHEDGRQQIGRVAWPAESAHQAEYGEENLGCVPVKVRDGNKELPTQWMPCANVFLEMPEA